MSGKFSSELAELLYEVSLEGFADDEAGDVDGIGWFARFDNEQAILSQDGLGFVDVFEYGSADELSKAWDSVLAADDDYYDDGEFYGWYRCNDHNDEESCSWCAGNGEEF